MMLRKVEAEAEAEKPPKLECVQHLCNSCTVYEVIVSIIIRYIISLYVSSLNPRLSFSRALATKAASSHARLIDATDDARPSFDDWSRMDIQSGHTELIGRDDRNSRNK